MKKHNNELEIDEHLAFERKTWTVQRISWVIMFLIIVAALLGFTGRGGLAGINKIKKTTSSNSLEVEYDRFLRNEVTGELQMKLQDITTTAPAIHFSKEFYEKIRVEQVIPEPENVEVDANGITYTFNMTPPEGKIIFYTKPMHMGPLTITAHGPDNQAVTISHFVYP